MAQNFVRKAPLVVVLGATGAGKSKLALELAARYRGEVVSADSMQVYRDLDIVTNKVTEAERGICPHHLLDFVNPLKINYTVVDFRDSALQIIEDIHSRQNVPVIVGGTNYYIESLLWNMLIDAPQKSPNATVSSSIRDPSDATCLTTSFSESNPSATEAPPGRLSKHPPACESHTEVMASLRKQATAEIYKHLCEVDEDQSMKIHPNDRRKLLRALEVFYTKGCSMSDYLRRQHAEAGLSDGAISGSLRFPDPCIIWVRAEQKVLDDRTDRRVDQMIELGLVSEMLDFHRNYNLTRLEENSEADYTVGVFQSIGFKEFHEYLLLSEAERETESGKQAFLKGVSDMKTATRQYSRKQMKWIKGRFLKRGGGATVPPVYAVDSTEPSEWESTVLRPAQDVLESYLQGQPSSHQPVPTQDSPSNAKVYNRCDVCDVTLLTEQQWLIHLKGNRHKKRLGSLRRAVERREGLTENTPSHVSANPQSPSPGNSATMDSEKEHYE